MLVPFPRAKAPLACIPTIPRAPLTNQGDWQLNELVCISPRKTVVVGCFYLLHGRKTYTNGVPHPSKRLAA